MRPSLGSVFPKAQCWDHLFFILYTAPLGDIACMHGLKLHLYADNTQVYITFCPISKSDTDSAVRKINACVAGIRTWMIQNRLQLNDSKIEALLACAPHMCSKLAVLHLEGGVSRTVPLNVVRNIGAFLDQNLNMQHHVKQLCRKASFQLGNIGKIPHLLCLSVSGWITKSSS